MSAALRLLGLTAVPLSLLFFDSALAAEGPDPQSRAEIDAAKARVEADFADVAPLRALSDDERARILDQYSHLDPRHEVPVDLLATAVVFFDQNKAKFPNQKYLSVVDFGPRSDRYRFFLVDLRSGAVEKFHTTHGAGSDTNRDGMAETFGNVIDSGKSSLGFARTAEVYTGTYGRALRLDGLSKTNSNIRERAIVFHGWDGVKEENVIQGLSLGCITLDWRVKNAVLGKIRSGSLLYVGVANKRKASPE